MAICLDFESVCIIFNFFRQTFVFDSKDILIINEENIDLTNLDFDNYFSNFKTTYLVQNDVLESTERSINSKVSLFSISSIEFLKLAKETITTFDFIIYFIAKQKLKEFKIKHKEIIDQVLNELLRKSGIFVLVFEFEGEVLTEYPISKLFRRMSDNLTKKIFDKTTTNICVHVFYK